MEIKDKSALDAMNHEELDLYATDLYNEINNLKEISRDIASRKNKFQLDINLNTKLGLMNLSEAEKKRAVELMQTVNGSGIVDEGSVNNGGE